MICLSPVCLGGGAAWSIDLRSFSVTALLDGVEAEPGGFNEVNGITPFVTAEWRLGGAVGVFGRVGANIALNETAYAITRGDREVEAVTPSITKLVYHLGLVIRI